MKRILLFLLTISVVFGSCKKKSSSEPSQMTASVDNKAWVSNTSLVKFDKGATVHLILTADSANTHMRLDIGNYTGIGTYVISDSGNTASFTTYSAANGSALHKATSGQIVVKQVTTNGTNQNGFKGTFEFLADTVQVTAGTFNVNLYLN